MAEKKKKCSECYYAQNGACLCGDSPKYGKLTLLIFKVCDHFATHPNESKENDKNEEETWRTNTMQ